MIENEPRLNSEERERFQWWNETREKWGRDDEVGKHFRYALYDYGLGLLCCVTALPVAGVGQGELSVVPWMAGLVAGMGKGIYHMLKCMETEALNEEEAVGELISWMEESLDGEQVRAIYWGCQAVKNNMRGSKDREKEEFRKLFEIAVDHYYGSGDEKVEERIEERLGKHIAGVWNSIDEREQGEGEEPEEGEEGIWRGFLKEAGEVAKEYDISSGKMIYRLTKGRWLVTAGMRMGDRKRKIDETEEGANEVFDVRGIGDDGEMVLESRKKS